MENINKWRMRLAVCAEAMDYFRIVPRLIIVGYSLMLYEVVQWFMSLPNPNMEQSTLVSVIVTIAGVVIGLYTKSGHSWDHPITIWSKDSKPKIRILEEDDYSTNGGNSVDTSTSTRFTEFPDID